ncbi:MAG: response regulator [Candidatus Brocadiia bacterium]
MKLDEFTAEMLAQAMDVYLRAAYPHGEIPPPVRELAAVDPRAPLEEALGREEVQKFEAPGRPGFIDKYRWRLGNVRYPHMKLGIERCSEADDFVFNVDTHDRGLPLGSPAAGEPAYHELLAFNTELKRVIERRWLRHGLPTLYDHLAGHLRRQCALPQGRPKTVLIVDDDPSILELEQALVEEAGYRVVAVTGGVEALAEVGRPEAIDLCLLDIMMPTVDGLAVARRLRREGRLDFPIVYVTALPPERARDDIAADYVGKPFDPDHLVAVVRKHIG